MNEANPDTAMMTVGKLLKDYLDYYDLGGEGELFVKLIENNQFDLVVKLLIMHQLNYIRSNLDVLVERGLSVEVVGTVDVADVNI